MDIAYTRPLQKNSYAILRDAGYIPIFDRLSGKQSFVHKIRGDRYPRFHLYVEEDSPQRIKWHVHLDEKEHGWSERRHDTDYEGEAVREEGERLMRWIAYHAKR